jgi:hypothetical protein
MRYRIIFLDGDLKLYKPKDFDCNSYLEYKSTYRILKSLQEHVRENFDIVPNDVHCPLAIYSLGRKQYLIMFINEYS